jgi:Flp pilus assembly pilin Flp
MDGTTAIRLIAGLVALVLVAVVIYRRNKAKSL